MRFPIRPLALGAVLTLLAGCGISVSPQAAATVDDVEITRELLETVVDDGLDAQFPPTEGAGAELADEQRDQAAEEQQRQLLTLLIQDALITSVAAEADVEVDDAEQAAVRADIVASVEGEEQLEQLLVQEGLSLSLFEEVLVPQQARVAALRQQLAEGESLETRTVRHILVDEEAEADEIVSELEGGADFGELAEERSTDTGSGAQGGDLGPAPRGTYVPPFEEAVWEAELNQLVGPVQSEFGFHVLEVLEEDVTPAEELPPQALDQLVSAELNERILSAYEDAEIEVDPALGTWDEETRSVVPTEPVGEPATQDPGLEGLDQLGELGDPEDQSVEP